MNIQKFFIGLLVVTFSLSIFADHHKGDGMKNKPAKKGMIAKKMVESGYKGKDPFLKMVKKHMADDGYQYPSRFVGFGFYYDPNGDQPDVVINKRNLVKQYLTILDNNVTPLPLGNLNSPTPEDLANIEIMQREVRSAIEIFKQTQDS